MQKKTLEIDTAGEFNHQDQLLMNYLLAKVTPREEAINETINRMSHVRQRSIKEGTPVNEEVGVRREVTNIPGQIFNARPATGRYPEGIKPEPVKTELKLEVTTYAPDCGLSVEMSPEEIHTKFPEDLYFRTYLAGGYALLRNDLGVEWKDLLDGLDTPGKSRAIHSVYLSGIRGTTDSPAIITVVSDHEEEAEVKGTSIPSTEETGPKSESSIDESWIQMVKNMIPDANKRHTFIANLVMKDKNRREAAYVAGLIRDARVPRSY